VGKEGNHEASSEAYHQAVHEVNIEAGQEAVVGGTTPWSV
jgi:hypothetical protein